MLPFTWLAFASVVKIAPVTGSAPALLAKPNSPSNAISKLTVMTPLHLHTLFITTFSFLVTVSLFLVVSFLF
jgi:hypothetical protein